MEESVAGAEHKTDVRSRVWSELIKVAKPDSRFHFDFAEFIADFEGSSEATNRFVQLESYSSAQLIFITPDNCLEELRLASLQAGKSILTTTYGIRRGFWLLDPKVIPVSKYDYVCTFDGMEKWARSISLADIRKEKLAVDLMVTGTGAINLDGVRFGKGHGYFDLEWAMLYTIGAATVDTPAAAVVHDCQILEEKLIPEDFDTVCDIIVTPTRVVHVQDVKKPLKGIIWEKLAEGMMEEISPLQELKQLQTSNSI